MPNYPGKRKGTRRIVIWVKGRPKEKTIRGSKPDGDVFEARWRLELDAHVHNPRAVTSFEQLCTEKYCPFAAANLAKSTWRARSHIIVNLIEFFGEKALDSFTLGDFEAYRAHRRKASKLSPSSMNTEILAMLYVLRWAEARGYRVAIPKVKLAKPPKGRPRIWTDDEVARLLDVTRTHDPWMLPLVVFLVNTGCRKGEAIAAEWSWVDFKANQIRIPATAAWSPKSGRAREVPLADAVKAALAGEKRSPRWVFANRDGTGFSYFPDARFKELQTLAGVTGGPHTLRHYFASCFLRNGGSMWQLSAILGHTHERVTALYSHLLPGYLEAARNIVNVAPTMGLSENAMGRKSKKPA